jgi:hypothetical protein
MADYELPVPFAVKLTLDIKKAPWPESVSELYRPNDRRLSAKLVPTFACHVASGTDPEIEPGPLDL